MNKKDIILSICLLTATTAFGQKQETMKDTIPPEYTDITHLLSVEAFEAIKTFILKEGDRQTWCNMYNNNPHYSFPGFEAYLNPEIGQKNINCDPAKSDYNEIVIRNFKDDSHDYFHFVIIREGDLKKTGISCPRDPGNLQEQHVYVFNKFNYPAEVVERWVPFYVNNLTRNVRMLSLEYPFTAKVLAGLTGTRSTGKRHNSFFFTFKVQKVMKGDYKDSTFGSGEIFHDFGASAIFSKTSNDRPVILKLAKYPDGYKLLWVSEPEREKELEALENLLFALKGAFKKKDYNIIQPFVSNKQLPENKRHLSKAVFDEIVHYHKELYIFEMFMQIVTHMLEERVDRPFFACGGGYDYTFKIEKEKNTNKWKITQVVKR